MQRGTPKEKQRVKPSESRGEAPETAKTNEKPLRSPKPEQKTPAKWKGYRGATAGSASSGKNDKWKGVDLMGEFSAGDPPTAGREQPR
jgi:hypothetical protein